MTDVIEDRKVAALERIATALEQIALEQMPAGLPTGEPPLPTPPPELVQVSGPAQFNQPPVMQPLPPVTPPFTFTPNLACPIHHLAWKIVPAGVSKKSGRAYAAFAVCPESGCEQRPPQ